MERKKARELNAARELVTSVQKHGEEKKKNLSENCMTLHSKEILGEQSLFEKICYVNMIKLCS